MQALGDVRLSCISRCARSCLLRQWLQLRTCLETRGGRTSPSACIW